MITGCWILLKSRSLSFASMKNLHYSQKHLRFGMKSNLQKYTECSNANRLLVKFLVRSFHVNFLNFWKKIQFGSQIHTISALIIFFICGLNPRDQGDFLLVWILLPEGRKSDKIFDQTQKPNKGPSIRSDEHHIGDTGGYKEIKNPVPAKWKKSTPPLVWHPSFLRMFGDLTHILD